MNLTSRFQFLAIDETNIVIPAAALAYVFVLDGVTVPIDTLSSFDVIDALGRLLEDLIPLGPIVQIFDAL